MLLDKIINDVKIKGNVVCSIVGENYKIKNYEHYFKYFNKQPKIIFPFPVSIETRNGNGGVNILQLFGTSFLFESTNNTKTVAMQI